MKLNLYVVHSRIVEGRMANVNRLVDVLKKADDFDAVSLEVINDNESDAFTQDSIRAVTDFSQLGPEVATEISTMFNPIISPIHVRHISNLLNHISALKRIAACEPAKDEFHVVLEDDVVYGDIVSPSLSRALKASNASNASNASGNFDIMFLGLPSAQITGTDDKSEAVGAFLKYYNITPVCDSYAVSVEGARKLVALLLPMKFPTHIQLSFAIHKAKLDACFSRPNVFIDGSKLGVFVSSIETNNNLILSAEYQSLKTMVEESQGPEGAQKTREFYETMRFKNHPDNVRLLADLEHKTGNFAKSKELYDACFAAFSSNGCVLNNQSQFMKTYITACRDF